ncbi:hypothetical protein CPLU01_00894 [Colletotrichum plurivorum]|uniref:Uncharacterized protein n=1 Tax=Colletotrichum plurivorum TaxID=2175906 RepID=A0A8H6U4Y0_9PEZI|nr:hypothetical protein CPLU01_00894 [Colletotrichum plurivorum]
MQDSWLRSQPFEEATAWAAKIASRRFIPTNARLAHRVPNVHAQLVRCSSALDQATVIQTPAMAALVVGAQHRGVLLSTLTPTLIGRRMASKSVK